MDVDCLDDRSPRAVVSSSLSRWRPGTQVSFLGIELLNIFIKDIDSGTELKQLQIEGRAWEENT